jgi:hypothetical protein
MLKSCMHPHISSREIDDESLQQTETFSLFKGMASDNYQGSKFDRNLFSGGLPGFFRNF